jgi:formylglycine-generating enzyme required for sulfatase activity
MHTSHRPAARTVGLAPRRLLPLLVLPLLLVACSDDPTDPSPGADSAGDLIPPDLSMLEVYPADGATDVSDRVLFWEGVFDQPGSRVTYRVDFGPENPPSARLHSGRIHFCSIGLLLPGTTYHWRLVAVDDAGNTAESEVFSFTTSAEPAPRDLVPIAPGTFTMGSPADEHARADDEAQHTVTLTTAFWMQATEVTNQQYVHHAQWALDQGLATLVFDDDSGNALSLRDAMDGSDVELLDLDAWECEVDHVDGRLVVELGKRDHPVREVSWFGAAAFCDWLSLRHGLPRAYDHATWQCNGGQPYAARAFRLPTEAEWEYACRAGTTTPFSSGDCLAAGIHANVNGISPYPGCPVGPYVAETTPAASFQPNPWGLYDLHGNLREWCNDRYARYDGDVTDPVGPAGSAGDRVFRGGIAQDTAVNARSACRYRMGPSDPYERGAWVGFRVVWSNGAVK